MPPGARRLDNTEVHDDADARTGRPARAGGRRDRGPGRRLRPAEDPTLPRRLHPPAGPRRRLRVPQREPRRARIRRLRRLPADPRGPDPGVPLPTVFRHAAGAVVLPDLLQPVHEPGPAVHPLHRLRRRPPGRRPALDPVRDAGLSVPGHRRRRPPDHDPELHRPRRGPPRQPGQLGPPAVRR